MRRDPTKWTVRSLQALAFLLLIAFGAHEIWMILKPMVPVLISLIVVAIVLWIIFRGRW